MAILLRRQTPAAEARAAWEQLTDAERLELLDLLEERLVVPRPIEVHVGERRNERKKQQKIKKRKKV